MNAAEHLESFLGEINSGFSHPALPGVQICVFANRPCSGVTTLATLGLSKTILEMDDGRVVRQELLFGIPSGLSLNDAGKVLGRVAEAMLERKQALLRGEVVRLRRAVISGRDNEWFYGAIPVVYPDGIAALKDSDPPTVVVWLVAVRADESDFVKSEGWSDFEDRLESAGSDLFDLDRESVVKQS